MASLGLMLWLAASCGIRATTDLLHCCTFLCSLVASQGMYKIFPFLKKTLATLQRIECDKYSVG